MTIKNNELPPLEDMLAEFESGSIPRSETWQALITGLYLNVEQVAEIEKWYKDINTIYGQIIKIQKEMQESYGQIQLWYGQVDAWQQQVAEDKVAAASSAANAASSASAALASENKAYKWAEEKEDVEVEPGEYSSHHWANKAKQHSGSITNGMYFAGRWDMKDGLPPEPDENLVPWYRIITADPPANRKDADPVWLALVDDAKPGDQLCWDPIAKEYFLVDCTDKVWSVNGMVGDVVLSTSAPPGRLNFFLNGDFRFWQRGDNFEIRSQYIADRWAVTNIETLETVRCERGNDALRMINTKAIGGEHIALYQRIECNPKYYSKAPFNLSFTLTWTVAPGTCEARIIWLDKDTAKVGDSAIYPLMVLASRQSHVINAPEAKTGAVYLQVALYFTGAFNMEVTEIQLSLGETLYPFKHTHVADELALCQRYYEKSYFLNQAPGTHVPSFANMLYLNVGVYNSTGVALSCPFKVSKRTTPTMVLYSSLGTPNTVSTDKGEQPAMPVIGDNAFHIAVSDVQWMAAHWVADAEI